MFERRLCFVNLSSTHPTCSVICPNAYAASKIPVGIQEFLFGVGNFTFGVDRKEKPLNGYLFAICPITEFMDSGI
jgi:hypothetical protein